MTYGLLGHYKLNQLTDDIKIDVILFHNIGWDFSLILDQYKSQFRILIGKISTFWYYGCLLKL